MGVDATVFVLAEYSTDVGYVVAAFTLDRDRGFWDEIQKVERAKPWAAVQLPQGGWSQDSDGRAGDAVAEQGYLFEDAYGVPLTSAKGADYRGLAAEPGLNGAVFGFVYEHYPDHDVVILWH